ncbi:zinc finger protein RFP-like [Archocentrus centrarchus]|uniref:zinc finger protein RFP-like n=1 Tax=Archocentrus centrarchus TaxID=63155 RepID=UPI0011EA0E2C|nr:zinc finger protein RFP-like [Archocentrus centrarchus]
MIQERKIKIQQMKHSVELNKKAADREMAEGVQVFTALIESAKTDLNSLIKAIEEKQRTAEKRAEGFIKGLEKEISELMKLSPGVERQQSDHNFSSMNISPTANKGTKVSVHPQAGVSDRLPSYDGMVVRAVNQLEKTHSKQLRRLTEAELQRVRQYTVNVALDPSTVEPWSSQSVCKCVLSKQGFSAGRFYFEVSVKSHSSWTVGVATDMPYLKKEISLSPENGYWTISSGRGRLFSLFQDSKLEKVGVFVNYDDGLICFYDVLGAALIHSSTGCTFTKNIHPFFSPCSNNGVQIHTSACVIS